MKLQHKTIGKLNTWKLGENNDCSLEMAKYIRYKIKCNLLDIRYDLKEELTDIITNDRFPNGIPNPFKTKQNYIDWKIQEIRNVTKLHIEDIHTLNNFIENF